MDLASAFLPEFFSENLLLCKLLLCLDQISGGGGGAKVSEETPPVEESQASDSIMSLSNSGNNRFSSKMGISHHIYESFSARIIQPREI